MVYYPVTVLPPSGDQTGATDTARINAVIGAGKYALLQENGTYYTSNLLIDTYGVLAGQGAGAIIQAVAGTTGYMVALKTPAKSYQCTVTNVTLIPNTGSLGGINLDNTGYTTPPGGSFDTLHVVDNVSVFNAGGHSFRFGQNIRSARITRNIGYSSTGGSNFYFDTGATDNYVAGNISGHSGLHGFQFNDGNNWIIGNKAFYAGYNGSAFDTTHSGFYFNAINYCTVVGNSAQQNALHGFDVQSCHYTTLTGNEADTNSAGTTTGVGINLNANVSCVINANVGANNGGISPGAQAYGYQVAGTQTGTLIFANTITGSSGQFNYVSGGGYTIVDGFSVQLGAVQQLQIPAAELTVFTPQALSTGATITVGNPSYGILPVTETGNVTGIILAGGANGQTVKILNRSNFTITFAAAGTSFVADGASDVIPALAAREFTYDSSTSLWYRTG